tara:strand:+ start:3993 stop:4553 length:561 start_codon:yes stop_codon:yes gene_type:complete
MAKASNLGAEALGCFEIRNNQSDEADMSTTAKSPAKSKTTSSASKTSDAKSGATTPSAAKPASPKPTQMTPTRAPISALDGKTPMATKAGAPTVVETPQAVILGPVMRKKELIDTVVTRSGMKKKDAKPIVDTMLAVLGEALADNRELILPPMGRVKVRKEKKLPNGRVLVVKVRQTTPLKTKEDT